MANPPRPPPPPLPPPSRHHALNASAESYAYDESDEDHADDDGGDDDENASLSPQEKEQLEEHLWFELDIDEDRDEPVFKVLVIAITACAIGCFCRAHCCHGSKGRHHLIGQQPFDNLTPPESPTARPALPDFGFAEAGGLAPLAGAFERNPHRADHACRPSLGGAGLQLTPALPRHPGAPPSLTPLPLHQQHHPGHQQQRHHQQQPGWPTGLGELKPIDGRSVAAAGQGGGAGPRRREDETFKSFGARFDVFSRIASSLEL
jgi:hypothetical protein